MLIPKRIRKIIAIFRGEISPKMLFLGVLLGFWFGVTPGFSGFHTLVVLICLVVNIHVGIFLLSAGIGKAVCFGLAPMLYYVGVFVVNSLPWLLGLLSAVPLIGLTNFDTYAVSGAMLIGPVGGAIIGYLFSRSVMKFRYTWLKLSTDSGKFSQWQSKKWVMTLDRLLIGKSRDAKLAFEAKSKVIRKAGVVVAAVVLAVSLVAVVIAKNGFAKDFAADVLSRANGAEVNINELSISLLTGSIKADGVQVTDPKKPASNTVAISKLTADASLYGLLTGRVVMDDIEVAGITFDQKRDTPGKIIGLQSSEGSRPVDIKITAGQAAKMGEYMKNAKGIKEWLEKISKWLPKSKKAAATERQVPKEYLEFLSAKASVATKARIIIKKIVLSDMEIPFAPLANSTITARNLNDAPVAAGLPIKIKVQSQDTKAAVYLRLDFPSNNEPALKGNFENFELAKIQEQIFGGKIIMESGTANGSFGGMINNELIDLLIDVNIKDMQASFKKGMFSKGDEAASSALKKLTDWQAVIQIAGPVTEPKIAVDTSQLKEAIAQAAVDAVKDQAVKKIEEKLGDKVPKNLMDGIKGIFNK